jgi:hypothetical protein
MKRQRAAHDGRLLGPAEWPVLAGAYECGAFNSARNAIEHPECSQVLNINTTRSICDNKGVIAHSLTASRRHGRCQSPGPQMIRATDKDC